jgi:hypothetical protein
MNLARFALVCQRSISRLALTTLAALGLLHHKPFEFWIHGGVWSSLVDVLVRLTRLCSSDHLVAD